MFVLLMILDERYWRKILARQFYSSAKLFAFLNLSKKPSTLAENVTKVSEAERADCDDGTCTRVPLFVLGIPPICPSLDFSIRVA